MVMFKCTSKVRNRNNTIKSYVLQDRTGATQTVPADMLKEKMLTGEVFVSNLKLTSDNRIIDMSDKEMQKIREVASLCNKLHFSFDASKISGNNQSDRVLRYNIAKEFLGVEIGLSIEITEGRASVLITSNEFEIEASGTRTNIRLQKLTKLMDGYNAGVTYYSSHIGQLIKLCCDSVTMGECAKTYEESQYRIFNRIITANGLTDKAKEYVKTVFNKAKSSEAVVSKLENAIAKSNEDISLDDVILYKIFYSGALNGAMPEASSIELMPDGIRRFIK